MIHFLAVGSSGADPKHTSLEEAATQLESTFLYELMKEMQATVQESTLFGKPKQERSVFREMYFQQLADVLAKRSSLGIKEMIIEAYKNHA